MPAALPPWQIVRERRATFAATPAQDAKRPGAATQWSNLVLAGDWTDTGLPATIEGAIRSGNRAADIIASNAIMIDDTSNSARGGQCTSPAPDVDALEERIHKATHALLAQQRPDGHWVFELEADATIPAEYVLLRHYLGEPVDAALEAKIAVYLRRIQGAHGGWPLFRDGELDISATVKAYFALKMIGDSVDADHMRRAREAVCARGGAERANVFTRIMLALFGFVPWRAVPVMPVEIMLLPRWFPFHLDKISYWSRTVIVPLLVLMAKKPARAIAQGRPHRRAFRRAAEQHRPDAEGAAAEGVVVLVLPRRRQCPARDRAVCSRKRTRQRAIDGAVAWSSSSSTARMGSARFFRRWRTA